MCYVLSKCLQENQDLEEDEKVLNPVVQNQEARVERALERGAAAHQMLC